MEYTECGSSCTRTCASLYKVPSQDCTLECHPKCQCRPGLFYHDGRCIAETECPCFLHRHEYSHGSRAKMGCNNWLVRLCLLFVWITRAIFLLSDDLLFTVYCQLLYFSCSKQRDASSKTAVKHWMKSTSSYQLHDTLLGTFVACLYGCLVSSIVMSLCVARSVHRWV